MSSGPDTEPRLGPSWTVRIASTAGGKPREYTITARQLRRIRLLAAAIVGLVVLFGLGFAFSLPRSVAYDGLLQENLSLKLRLQEIDRRMAEIDRILLRLRLYDAQLESLSEPRGDHGPVAAELFSNAELEGVPQPLAHPLDHAPMEPEPELSDWGGDPKLRPAEAWASAVQGRAETFLALFARAEPNLNQLVEELEDLRALESAFPSYWPAFGKLTSGYGWRRNPLGHSSWRFHSGIDIAGKRGTPIYAAAPGTVVKAAYNSGYGRMIEIDHGYGITTIYAHCHLLLVAEGDRVQKGDLIGQIGSTGRSTGPHLHFEVRLDGHAVDPLDYVTR